MTIKSLEQFVTQCKTCSPVDNPEKARELIETAVLIAEDVIKKRSKRTPDDAKCYGEYGNVKLSDKQLNKLIEDFGIALVEKVIVEVDLYCQQHNKNDYSDFSAVIRNFINRKGIKPKIPKGDKSKCPY